MLFAGASDGGDTGEDSGDSVDDGTDGSTGSGHAVFISEYIEGSSFNKAVEIYNGSKESLSMLFAGASGSAPSLKSKSRLPREPFTDISVGRTAMVSLVAA